MELGRACRAERGVERFVAQARRHEQPAGTQGDAAADRDSEAVVERGGTVFRIVDFPPETAEMRNLDPSTMHHSLGDGAPKRGLPPRHPAMHRTRTVDYAIVMAGEIDMLIDSITSTAGPIASGRVKPVAVSHSLISCSDSRHRRLFRR